MTGFDHLAVDAIEQLRDDVAQILASGVATDAPILASWDQLLTYLRFDMGNAPVERVRALYLNTRNALLRDRTVSVGTIDRCEIHVREVIVGALEVGAAAILLVHNHPSGGNPKPSRSDIEVTRAIADAGRRLNIALFDHVIVSAKGHLSMRTLGLI